MSVKTQLVLILFLHSNMAVAMDAESLLVDHPGSIDVPVDGALALLCVVILDRKSVV